MASVVPALSRDPLQLAQGIIRHRRPQPLIARPLSRNHALPPGRWSPGQARGDGCGAVRREYRNCPSWSDHREFSACDSESSLNLPWCDGPAGRPGRGSGWAFGLGSAENRPWWGSPARPSWPGVRLSCVLPLAERSRLTLRWSFLRSKWSRSGCCRGDRYRCRCPRCRGTCPSDCRRR